MNEYGILVWKTELRRPLRELRCKWKDNIKIGLRLGGVYKLG
jgi:hypothetical protein